MVPRFRFLAAGLLLGIILILNAVPLVLAADIPGTPAAPAQPSKTLLPFGGSNYPGSNIVDTYVKTGTGSSGIVATLQNLLTTAKGILAPILVFFIAGFGIRLVIAGGNEEEFNKASKHFLYLLIGTAFVIFASFMSDTFSLYQVTQTPDGQTATSFVQNPGQILATTDKLKSQIFLVIKFLRYLLGGIAVFYVVRSGSNLMFNADEEMATKQKEIFMYGFIGFLLIMISDALVLTVFNISSPGQTSLQSTALGEIFTTANVNVQGGVSLLGNITNLFLAGLSGLFLFSLIAGGTLYAFSAGNEQRGEQATKVIIGSLIGLVIAFSSYTLVAEFSSGGQQLRQATQVTVPLKEGLPAPTPSSP